LAFVRHIIALEPRVLLVVFNLPFPLFLFPEKLQLRYDLPQTYKFHKKKEVDIAVDLWRFVPNAQQ
jgi:predicted RNA methylase